MMAIPPLGDPELELACAKLRVQARPACVQESAAQAEAGTLAGSFLPFEPAPPAGRRHLHWRAEDCKKAIAVRSALRWRALLHAAVAKNEPVPPRDFAESEASGLIQAFCKDEPQFASWPVATLEADLRADREELDQVARDLEGWVAQYAEWGDEGHFERVLRPALGRRLVLAGRVPRRTKALSDFQAQLPKVLAKTCGHGAVAELISGVGEAWSLAGLLARNTPGIQEAERELAGVNADLEALAVGIEPGPVTNRLLARRRDLGEHITSARAEAMAASRQAIEAPVRWALSGDVGAWNQIAASLAAAPESFDEGLRVAFLQAPVRAMLASGPVSFAEAICGSVAGAGGLGREFLWT